MKTILFVLFTTFCLTKAVDVCSTDTDCAINAIKKVCSGGFCFEGCRNNGQCPTNKPRCNLNYQVGGENIGLCDIECRSDFDCRTDAAIDNFNRFCKIGTATIPNKCVSCRTNVDCANQVLPLCSVATGECVSCTKDADCAAHVNGKFCKPAAPGSTDRTCGCRTNTDCATRQAGNICHGGTGVCSCNSNTDCKVKNFGACSDLDGTINTCGACGTDAECPPTNGTAICFSAPTNGVTSKRCVNMDCSRSVIGTRVIGGQCGCRDDGDCETLANTPACDCAVSKCITCTRDSHCRSFERCNDAKKCVALKCTQDFECFRNDLINEGRNPSNEARCSDQGACVATAPVCIGSVAV